MKRFSRKSRSGFTLVELLIVVAIIGVLATIGVPTFKKMVQKAKKSEAKVSLGALYTVETAFFSEYGSYGNNLNGVAYELDGTSATRIYSSGFTNDTACVTNPTLGGTPAPISSGTGAFGSLVSAYPAYYNNAVYVMVGNVGKSINAGTAPCSWSGLNTIGVPSNGTYFLAIAGGYINSTGPSADVWTMDNLRNLSNQQDGLY